MLRIRSIPSEKNLNQNHTSKWRLQKKDEIINSIKNKYITELIEPLQNQIKEIRDQKENKEKELQTAKNRREELESIKTIIATQISNFSDLKASIL